MSNTAERDRHIILWLTAVGFALLCVLRIFSTSPTGDEPFYVEMSQALFGFPVDWDTQHLQHHAPLGPLFQGAVRALLWFVPQEYSLHTARFGMLAFSALLGVVVYRFARALYGEACATAATFLVLWNPVFAGHASTANLDVALTALSFAAFYYWWQSAGGGVGRAAISGVFLGLALLTKHAAVVSAVIIGADALLGIARQARNGGDSSALRGWVLRLVVVGLVALFIVNAGYGFHGTGRSLASYPALSDPVIAASRVPLVSQLPLPLPNLFLRSIDYQLYVSNLGHPGFFRGEFSLDGWWSYQPVGFLLKNPIPLFIMLAFAIWHWMRRGAVQGNARSGERLLLLATLAFAIYFTFFNTRAQGVRYLLPGFPPLFVLLSGALASIDLKVRLWRGSVAGLGVAYAAAVLFSHPNEIAYLNSFSGGTESGYKTFLFDSNLDWGQTALIVDRALDEIPKPIATNPTRPATGRVVVQAASYWDYLDPTNRRAWLRKLEPESVLYGTHLLFDVTEEKLRERHAAEPDEPALAFARTSIRLDRGDPAGALEILEDSSLQGVDTPGLRILAGLAHARLERWEQAFLAWESAVKVYPNAAPAWSQLAFGSALWGRADTAFQAARAEVEGAKMAHASFQPVWGTDLRRAHIAASDWVVSNNRGFEAWSLGAYAQAVAHFREAVEYQPRFAHGHVNLARALEASGDLSGAIEAQRRGVELLPSARALRQPRVFFGDRVLLLGHALRCSTRGEAEESAYLDLLVERKELETHPPSVERDSKLARVFLRMGRPAVAMQHLRRAYEREPGRDRALIALLLRRFGIERESVDWLEH